MTRSELTKKVAAAEGELEIAERELKIALERLSATLVSDNVMVSNVISSAFERLKAAKREVVELKQLLDSSDAAS